MDFMPAYRDARRQEMASSVSGEVGLERLRERFGGAFSA